MSLDFSTSGGGINDENGVGTGLTHRLPGTGSGLPTDSTGLNLVPFAGRLLVNSTNSDLNGQLNLSNANFVGARLSSLGFSGSEDFSVSVTLRGVDYGITVDQFGVFVGGSSTQVFRAGGIITSTYRAFGVGNNGGTDTGYSESATLAPLPDDDLVLTLSRTGGVYTVTVQNLTNSARSGTLTITQPTYLNGLSDLTAGFFINNSNNSTTRVMAVDDFNVTVTPSSVPEPGTWLTAAAGCSLLALIRRRKAQSN